jgi:hypothetical protein
MNESTLKKTTDYTDLHSLKKNLRNLCNLWLLFSYFILMDVVVMS